MRTLPGSPHGDGIAAGSGRGHQAQTGLGCALRVPIVAKVLLLDNQAHMIELLRSKFEMEGFEVVIAESGGEGLALAQSEAPDLIVLDERMQDDEGVPVADRLRDIEEIADIPVILLTTRTGDAPGKDGSATVQMPFRPSQLLALVRENL